MRRIPRSMFCLDGLSLDKAHEQAVETKKKGESEWAKWNAYASARRPAQPNNQIAEGTFSLAEAIAALGAREHEAAELEKSRRETTITLVEQAIYAMFAWQNEQTIEDTLLLLKDAGRWAVRLFRDRDTIDPRKLFVSRRSPIMSAHPLKLLRIYAGANIAKLGDGEWRMETLNRDPLTTQKVCR
jgi:hypothetical protein